MLKQTVPSKIQNLLSCCTHFWFCFSIVVVAVTAAAADRGNRTV
jgi:hypothetical protein